MRRAAWALALGLLLAAGPRALAREAGDDRAPALRLTLGQLLERARKHAQLEAADHAIAAAEAQWREAVRAWIPQFEYQAVLAPSPDIRCFNLAGQRDTANCVSTSNPNPSIDAIGLGIFGRVEVKGGMPLYTFGKLAAARELATQGVYAAHRKADQTRADLELSVRKAYFGAKVTREVLATIAEGRERLTDAIARIEKDLDKDDSDVSETDLLRLRSAASTVDSRALEADKGRELARAALDTLAGTAGADVDDGPILPAPIAKKSTERWIELARLQRPESRLLDVAMAAKRQQLELEIARYYPDLALVGTLTYAYAGTADDPKNAFYADPFNTFGFGVALALKGTLDYHMKLPRVDRLRAELAELEANRRAAQGGIALEVRKALADVREAERRLPILERGKKAARSWLVAVTQSFSVGLAQARDFNDALVAYFEAELRTLQAVYDFNVAVAQLGRATGADPASP